MNMCILGDRLVLIGSDESKGIDRRRYRIVSLDTNSGDKIAEWVDEKSYQYAMLTSCIAERDRLYVAGITSKSWSLLVFDNDLNLINRRDYVNPKLVSLSLVITSEHEDSLYITGTSFLSDKITSIYVARVSSKDLNVLDEKTIVVDDASTGCYSTVYNESAGKIILGGYIKTVKGPRWLIVWINMDLEPSMITSLDIDGFILDSAVDNEGYVYMVDGNNIVKINSDGGIQARAQIPMATRVKCIYGEGGSLLSRIVVTADKEIIVLDALKMEELERMDFIEDKSLYLPYPSALAVRDNEIYVASTIARSRRDYSWYVARLALD